MYLDFKKKTTLKQLLFTFLPIILSIVLALLYTQYAKNLKDIKEREKQKQENIKNGVQLFIDNYDLSLALIEIQLEDRIIYLANQITTNHSINLITQDLEVLKKKLKMDATLEDLYIINPQNTIINATKNHDIGLDLNVFGTSYQVFFDKVRKDKKLIIERIATESKTKTPKKYGYLALPNNYILEIGIEHASINTLVNDFSTKLTRLGNQHGNIESISLFGSTEYLPVKNIGGKIVEQCRQVAINCYKNKTDTTVVFNTDKNIHFSYLPAHNAIVYEGYVLQIITNNNNVNTLLNTTKRNAFLTILGTLLLLSLIIYFFSKKITRPIYQLTAQIKRNCTNKSLEYIAVDGNYEINYLTQEFNKHIKNTKEQRHILEDKITERTQLLKQKNIELEKVSNERALLLEEIHHRVKNNLQLVSSLLNLQIKETNNTGAITALENSKNRIKTISLVHDKLCQNSNFITTNTSGYLQDLTDAIQQNIPEKIKVTVQPSTVSFNNDQATAIGLITHEFIINSVKHAFEGVNDATVSIIIENIKSNIIIKLYNNGKLLETDFNLTKTTSMGNKIIHGFVQILKGTFTFENQKNKVGVVMTITIPK